MDDERSGGSPHIGRKAKATFETLDGRLWWWWPMEEEGGWLGRSVVVLVRRGGSLPDARSHGRERWFAV